MMFVDVTATDSLSMRSLDVPLKGAKGAANLFMDDPMEAHNWAYPAGLEKTLLAEMAAAGSPASPAAERLKRLRLDMAGLYAALPKNQHGRLDNTTARYAVHRYFSKRHGWAIKGLEPAGAAWVSTMSVTPDVRQVSKYLVPAYLFERITNHHSDGKGLDLGWLAIYVATVEHLAHSQVLAYLYSVYMTLELPVAGAKTASEVEDIVATFMMVYMLGGNLEVSTKSDMSSLRRHLDTNHEAWQKLHGYVSSRLRDTQPAPSDFESIVGFLEDVADRYASWQDMDCQAAQKELQAMPGYANGRVPLAGMAPSYRPGRRVLFSEAGSYLSAHGIAERSGDGESEDRVIVSNYLLSQGMCLPTAGYHAVCCRNPCEAFLERLEAASASPQVAPARALEVLGDDLRRGGALERASAELTKAAAQSGGALDLHGRLLADWLHSAFPLECPKQAADGGANGTDPRTPAEWMAPPGHDSAITGILLSEAADTALRFTTLGPGGRPMAEPEAPDDEEPAGTEIETRRAGGRPVARWHGMPGAVFKAALLASGSAMVVRAAAQALRASGVRGPGAGKALLDDSWA